MANVGRRELDTGGLRAESEDPCGSGIGPVAPYVRITGKDEEETNMDANTTIICDSTGSTAQSAEIIRGDVLIIDFNEAAKDRDYAEQVLRDALAAEAPGHLVQMLREHVAEHTAGADASIPVVVTGGDTAHGEVVRGEVLLIHYDDAAESLPYAEEMLREAQGANAPAAVIESLMEIIQGHK